MDQVTLVGPQDIQSIKLHMLATHINNQSVTRTFYIHPDIEDFNNEIVSLSNSLPEQILDKVTFIKEEELLDTSVCSNKWIYQQLLKLSVDQLRDTHNLSEPFLFTDVDTLCLRNTGIDDLQKEGRFIFFVESDNEQPLLADNFNSLPLEHRERPNAYNDWFWSMNWSVYQLLGLEKAPHLSAINAFVVWSQRIMKKLKCDLEERFGIVWYEAIINNFTKFLTHYQRHFNYDPEAFRKICFSQELDNSDVKKPGFEELYNTIRLGFSEWQLYTYFLSTLDKSNYVIGLLGNTPHPLLAEYNCQKCEAELLDSILDASEKDEKKFPNFIYFYPYISENELIKIEKSLLDKLQEKQL